MTPAQRRSVRDLLRPRYDALVAANAASWFLTQGRVWLEDHTLSDAWWGACALLIRAEKTVSIRVDNSEAAIEAQLEQLRVAVGGSSSDGDFKAPWKR